MDSARPYALVLKSLILISCLAVGGYLIFTLGLGQRAIDADVTGITILIAVVYALASVQWLGRCVVLAREEALLERLLEDDASDTWPPQGQSPLADALRSLASAPESDRDATLEAILDDWSNRHALGHFLADTLLRLGLIGTVVGFILMLLPVGELSEFAPAQLQTLLLSMSAGMGVALFTTLAGLGASTLLKLQYYVADTHLARLSNRFVRYAPQLIGDHAA